MRSGASLPPAGQLPHRPAPLPWPRRGSQPSFPSSRRAKSRRESWLRPLCCVESQVFPSSTQLGPPRTARFPAKKTEGFPGLSSAAALCAASDQSGCCLSYYKILIKSCSSSIKPVFAQLLWQWVTSQLSQHCTPPSANSPISQMGKPYWEQLAASAGLVGSAGHHCGC